jgi:uncharacterized membrane protein
MTIAGLVAAVYAVVTITPGISAISYGPIQVRIAEALTVLPFLYVGAVPGLFVGCLLANIFGGLGMIDIVFGSLITLAAAYVTYLLRKTGRPYLAPLPPIILNSLGVSAYLHQFFDLPYWAVVWQIAIGETIACFVLGYPLLLYLKKKKPLFD